MRMVFGVRSGLRQQRRLTVLAIADEAPAVVFYALRGLAAVVSRLAPGRTGFLNMVSVDGAVIEDYGEGTARQRTRRHG